MHTIIHSHTYAQVQAKFKAYVRGVNELNFRRGVVEARASSRSRCLRDGSSSSSSRRRSRSALQLHLLQMEMSGGGTEEDESEAESEADLRHDLSQPGLHPSPLRPRTAGGNGNGNGQLTRGVVDLGRFQLKFADGKVRVQLTDGHNHSHNHRFSNSPSSSPSQSPGHNHISGAFSPAPACASASRLVEHKASPSSLSEVPADEGKALKILHDICNDI